MGNRTWGVAASFANVDEPQTNGMTERFHRTQKEQAINGHDVNDIEEARVAVRNLVNDYNDYWLVEKLGFLCPEETRKAWLDRQTHEIGHHVDYLNHLRQGKEGRTEFGIAVRQGTGGGARGRFLHPNVP